MVLYGNWTEDRDQLSYFTKDQDRDRRSKRRTVGPPLEFGKIIERFCVCQTVKYRTWLQYGYLEIVPDETLVRENLSEKFAYTLVVMAMKQIYQIFYLHFTNMTQ